MRSLTSSLGSRRGGAPRSSSSVGMASGVGAYGLWGLFPAFFGVLSFAGPVEVLAHRIVWTLVLMLVVLAVLGRLSTLRGLPARTWGVVALSSAFISINWGVYIYAVSQDRVVEAALGYFINPLVSVLLGVVVFRERLGRAQIAALALAFVAVVVLTVDYGRPPVIALTLAFSFALYGVMKKVVRLEPTTSLTAEGLVGAPIAIGYLVVLGVTGGASALSLGVPHALLLVLAGPVTALPLLLFGVAAQKLPLVTLGLLQYLTPGLQLAWGVLVLNEDMPASRWIGFALIWCALAIFTVDSVRRLRAHRVASVPVEAASADTPR
ncbi:chloramphenicol-sensitive protein RarD [Rhodococcus sp. PvP016]|uniref:Chloramphenicol-sensitive protein RarD n=2 Tax=Mycobacteriales TaxID=85007 RepID=A0ABS2KT33_9NOCA|nr:chloramphenicol-sensitive protein RarD [Rhodococcus corynebacterioides]MBP1117564.1 chloramphenicol-sensitive protein RarD [Rhodococcus sp. PvP016]